MFHSKIISRFTRGKCLLDNRTSNLLKETVTKRNRCLSNTLLSIARSRFSKSRVTSNSEFTLASTVTMATAWSMGPGTYEVPLSLFEKNRKRLASQLKSGQIVVLQGGDSINHYDTDVEYVFRQVSASIIYIIYSFDVSITKIYLALLFGKCNCCTYSFDIVFPVYLDCYTYAYLYFIAIITHKGKQNPIFFSLCFPQLCFVKKFSNNTGHVDI